MKFSSIRPPRHRWRVWVVAGSLAVLALALIARLIDLSVIDRHFLQTQYSERATREMVLPAYRGMITDRRGVPLAVSTPVYAAWADPKILQITAAQEKTLANILELPLSHLHKLLTAQQKRQFIYLKRDLPPPLAQRIAALNIKGIAVEKQYRRFYPEGAATAQLLGVTNIDDQGQEGLELAYNSWLAGQAGKEEVVRDRYGNEVADLGTQVKPVSGHNLVLSIDSRLQYIAYQALLQGVENFQAQYGSAIIIDVHTGEVLAMANVPSYNPNARPLTEKSSFRNRALTDLFEPGSTIKPLAMTAALTTGKYRPDSLVNTAPGYWEVDHHRIDDDGYNNGVINLTRILQVSSNVGMSKVILSIPPQLFLQLLHALGFGQPTGVIFPGENPGYINPQAATNPFVLATMSFGYGISVNLLQLAHAYATLGNDGVKIPLSLLKIDTPPKGIPVIQPAIAREIRIMLESVLQQGGTAVKADVPGYRVTGKTGTTRIVGRHGYEKNHHNSIFVGLAPASHPQLLVAVMLHDPQKKAYYGGFVAGPVFAQIMGAALRILDIPPDANTAATIFPLSAVKSQRTAAR